ncbi:ankyrin repeat-containing domain protein [Nemania abortiva]|nr:ankyrin repeat-containing domain protein [Nemania abortiva]
MAAQARTIPAEEWECYGQTITSLYSKKPLKDVRVEMERHHGFKASVYQFETQIRHVWGIRKNTKRKEWEALFEQDNSSNPESVQRTPAGCEKPPNSFKRARRYLKATQSSLLAQPSTSSRARARPASSELRDATTSSEIISPVQIDNLVLDLDCPDLRLPFDPNFDFDFENTLADLGARISSPCQTTSSGRLATRRSSTPGPINYRRLGGDITSFNCGHTLNGNAQLASPNCRNHSSPNLWSQEYHSELQVGLQIHSTIEPPICSKISFSSHFTCFEEFLRAKGVSFTRPGPTGSGSWSLISTGFTSRFMAEVVLSYQQSLTRGAPDLEKALSTLGSLIPGESMTLTTKDQAFETKLTRVLLFSILNGFSGLNHIPLESMLSFLGRSSIISRSFLTALKECSTYAAKTFVDIIFRASIEAKDKRTLEQLLEHRLVDVNDTAFFFQSRRYTPIERAARLRAYSLITTLLHHGADPNKTWDQNIEGALTQLLEKDKASISSIGWPPPRISATIEIIRTVDLLIKAGARVTPNHLRKAGELFTTYDLAFRLSLAISPSDHRAFFIDQFGQPSSCMVDIIRGSDDTQASQIIRNTIDLCETHRCGRCLVDYTENVEYATIQAAKLGHLKVVQLLINYIPSTTKVFCEAIRSRNKDLIDFVLSLNPDLNPPAISLELNASSYLTTPLAEAIASGNEDLIRYLHSAGAFAHLNKGNRLKPLIWAAASWGNISFIRQLLSYCDNSSHPHRVSARAIDTALRNGHEEVAWILLESGAVVRRGRSEIWPLRAALQSKNKLLVHAILSADISMIRTGEFNEALVWDDLSIVADLLSVNPPFLDSRSIWVFQNLCQRCVQDNNMDFFRHFVESASLPRISMSGMLEHCLQFAVEMAHSEMVCYLLDIGANPFTNGVLGAALAGRQGMFHLLFDRSRPRQAIPKCIGASVLLSVMDEGSGNPQALDALLETRAVNLIAAEELKRNEAEPDRVAVTPLGLALLSSLKTPDRDPWMVRALLDAGSDPNGVARSLHRGILENYTGLMLAIETARREVVQLLIDYGADVNLKPRFAVKRTPLQYAAELGHLDIVRMLLEQGADVNAEPAIRSGGSALQLAAISGNCNIVNELLANGALLDALPSRVEGRWPLEGAAENGRLDMIQFLWNAAVARGGIDVIEGFRRRHFLRAMNFARQNGHMGCRDLISDLSGVSSDRLDVENYGAPWLAYYSDWSYSPSSGDTPFLTVSDEWFDYDNDVDDTEEEFFSKDGSAHATYFDVDDTEEDSD